MASSVPNPKPRPQNTFFYDDDWTPAIDKWFIEKLLTEASKKNETLSWKYVANIRMATIEVNDLFDTSFLFRRCTTQSQKLEERHTVFSFITSLKDTVYYDESNNVVYAFHNYIWEYILLHPLGEAYKLKGEPAWHHLCTIFGTPLHVTTPRFQEYVDLTSIRDNSVENVQPIDQFPRQTFDMHMNNINSSFWIDLAEFGNEVWSDPSVCESQQSFDLGTSPHVTPPLITRSLWPKLGSVLIADSHRPKIVTAPIKGKDDRDSSTGSSNNCFNPIQRPGKVQYHGFSKCRVS